MTENKKFQAKSILSIPGVSRMENGDFSDDGNKFRMYKFKGIKFSYLRDGDQIYIHFNLPDEIPFQFKLRFQKLHPELSDKFLLADRFNGVSDTSFTIGDLKNSLEEFNDFSGNYVFPAYFYFLNESLINWPKFKEISLDLLEKRSQEVENLISQFDFFNDENISDYAWNMIKRYYRELKQDIARTKRDLLEKNQNEFHWWISEMDVILSGGITERFSNEKSFYFGQIKEFLDKKNGINEE